MSDAAPQVINQYDHERAHVLEQKNMFYLASYSTWYKTRLAAMLVRLIVALSMSLLTGYLTKVIGSDTLLGVAFACSSLSILCVWREFENSADLIQAIIKTDKELIGFLDSRLKFYGYVLNCALLAAYVCLAVYAFQ